MLKPNVQWKLMVWVLLFVTAASPADNWLGEWKLNVQKSKFSPGPGPKSQTITFEPSESGAMLKSEQLLEEGHTLKSGLARKYDGQDYPVISQLYPFTGIPSTNTVMFRRIDDNQFESVWKNDGKITMTWKATVSRDGKTLTISQTGTDSSGKRVNSIGVFER